MSGACSFFFLSFQFFLHFFIWYIFRYRAQRGKEKTLCAREEEVEGGARRENAGGEVRGGGRGRGRESARPLSLVSP